MSDLPTRAQLFEIGADDLIARAESHPVGRRISPEQVYTPGSDVNLILGGTSAMAEEVIRQLGKGLKDLTLDGAEGSALDRWVADRYSPEILRKSASPALVPLQLTRTSFAAGPVTFLSGSVVQTAGGVRFRTLGDGVFLAGSLGPVPVSARAVEAGTAGNVATNTINSFVTAKPDPTMLVTNPEPGAGGDNTESDTAFRARARAFFLIARRGVKAAIEFGALSVRGVRQAIAEELLQLPLGTPSGFVNCYVADPNGQSNSLLNAAVETALLDYRGYGVYVTVYGAVVVYQPVRLSLRYRTGIDTVAAWNAVRASVVAYVNSLSPNETLLVSGIIVSARRINGVIVEDSSVVVPAGDVVPTTGQIIRTRNDLVTPT